MTERPIIFSGPMVRAIIEGRKTMTRRVVKEDVCFGVGDCVLKVFGLSPLPCPYGSAGDRLWVRESFAVLPDLWSQNHDVQPIHYLEDVNDRMQIEDYTGKPSIHMPRWASRITLEVTGVRVERLQEISEPDARAEGVEACKGHHGFKVYGSAEHAAINHLADARDSFQTLWDSINGKRPNCAWSDNPWVWAVSFRRLP